MNFQKDKSSAGPGAKLTCLGSRPFTHSKHFLHLVWKVQQRSLDKIQMKFEFYLLVFLFHFISLSPTAYLTGLDILSCTTYSMNPCSCAALIYCVQQRAPTYQWILLICSGQLATILHLYIGSSCSLRLPLLLMLCSALLCVTASV